MIEFISFIRMNVIRPLIQMKNGFTPSGVRRIEMRAKGELPLLIKTVPDYDPLSCADAFKTIIRLYQELREYHKKPGLIIHNEAEKESIDYFDKVIEGLSK